MVKFQNTFNNIPRAETKTACFMEWRTATKFREKACAVQFHVRFGQTGDCYMHLTELDAEKKLNAFVQTQCQKQ